MNGVLIRSRERIGLVLGTAMLTLLLAWLGPADRLDHQIYDTVAKSWSMPVSSRVTIVTIDEPSLAELGRFPWSRKLQARLVDELRDAKVAAIGMDVIFAEPDWRDRDGDRALAEAAQKTENLVLPVFIDIRIPGEAPLAIEPLPELVEAGVGLGHVEMVFDSDGVVRRIARATSIDGMRHPAFVSAMLSRSQGRSDREIDAGLPTDHSIFARSDRFLIPFSARTRFDHWTFADIVQGRVPPDELRDRLVIVGATASGLGSSFSTPLTNSGASTPGLLLHAHLLHGLDNGVVWLDVSPGWRALLLALIVAGMAILVQRSRAPTLVLCAALACLVVASAALLQLAGLWLAPAPALIGGLAALIGWAVLTRRAEQAAARAERERAGVTLRAIADAVLTIDPQGRIDYLNPAAQTITGWMADSARGRLLAEVLRLDGEDENPIDLDRRDRRREREPVRILSRDGSAREVRISRGRIFDQKEKPAGHVIVLHDITEQERARRLFERSEEKRRQLERDLQHAGRLSAIGEVSASIAHEVAQPLTAIATYASAAKRLASKTDVSSRERLVDAVRKMAQQAERAGLVIRRLRRFFEKDREEVGEHDLAGLLDEALELALIGADRNGLEIDLDLDPSIEIIRCDRIQIQQVIVNLVRNAVEAMTCLPRELTITTRLKAYDVEIEIADSGDGIADDLGGALFEPFHSSKPGGMGLGLSISRSIVEAHGGELRAFPRMGRGTTFTFNLPLRTTVDA